MESSKIIVKVLSQFLIILVLFQGCAVYQPSQITLDQAVASRNKIKVTTRDYGVNIFHHIEKRDGAYFGFKSAHKDQVYLIKEDGLTIVELKDKRKSNLKALGVITVTVYGTIYAYKKLSKL